MRYKQFGRTDLQVSHLGFGTMHLPKLTQSEATRLLEYALEVGITYFDTAQNYGTSEQMIGQAIGHRRNEYVIGTKTNKRTYELAKKEIEDSLRKLRTDCLDILHIHYVNTDDEFNQVMSEQGAIRAVEEAKKAGYIRYVAISGHRPDKLAQWIQVYPFDSVLVHLNICQPFASTDLLPLAKGLGIGTIGMKALAGGFVKSEHLRYLLTQDVDIILPGFTNVEEINRNLGVLEQLPCEEETQLLLEMATYAGQHRCRRCNQCECPIGIKITDAIIPSIYLTDIVNDSRLNELWIEKRGPVHLCGTCVGSDEEAPCEQVCPYHVVIRDTIQNKFR